MKNWIKGASLIKAVALVALFNAGHVAAQTESHTVAKAKIEGVLNMAVSSVANSPVDGMLQVMTDRGIFYVSEDAKYLINGNIFNLDDEMRNETEEALVGVRKEGVKAFEDDAIEFKAKNEKQVITVYTDITCGYCRKLHNEIADYNDAGITVRYLAFPRGGLGSQSYDDLVSIWCADDKQEAMTKAKTSGRVAEAKTCESKVEEQFKFAQTVGVNSTPAIIFDDGTLQPGYRPAAAMAKMLGLN